MSEIISAIIGGAGGFGLFYVSFRLGRKSFERDLHRLMAEARKKAKEESLEAEEELRKWLSEQEAPDGD